jgi:hypothetical protein
MKTIFSIQVIIIFLHIFLLNIVAQSDPANHRKYWYFKSRLLNDFMKVGINQGDNIIINERGYSSGGFNKSDGGVNQIKIGDATSTLAYWLAVLSTEYELLKLNGQSTDSVLYQIYCSLYTINRLDLAAEKVLNKCNQGALNGFFVRDDVYGDYIKNNYEHFNYYSKGIQNNDSSRGFMSKFNFGVYSLDNSDGKGSDWYGHYEGKGNVWDGNLNLFNSQDQIYVLIYGLAFVRKYLPKNVVCKDASGNPLYFQDGLTSLSDEAKAIAARLVDYAREPYNCDNGQKCQGSQYLWHIVYPNCDLQSNDNKIGADFSGGTYTYPLAESACMIDNKDWGKKNNGAHFCAPTRCKSGTPPLENCQGLYHNPGSLTYGYTLWNWINSFIYPNYANQIYTVSINKPNWWPQNWQWPSEIELLKPLEYPRLFGGLLMSVCYCEYNSLLNFIPHLSSIWNTTGLYGVFTNNSKNKIDILSRRTATTYYYHFPYSLALLHDLKVDVNESPSGESIIDLINEMNPCNHYEFGQNNWSSFSWSTDTRTEHLERIGYNQGTANFTGEYPAYDFLLYHNLWYLYNKKQNNGGINSYMTDLGDILIDKNNVPVNAYNVDAYETTVMRNTPFVLAPHNSHKYIRAGKEIVFKPGTHIYAASITSIIPGNIETPPYTVTLTVKSGLRAYIKGYGCAFDIGSYDPTEDASYQYRTTHDFSLEVSDSVMENIIKYYPSDKNNYHYMDYPEEESIENDEPEFVYNNEWMNNESEYRTFSLYPNPSKGQINLKIRGNQPAYFKITDVRGKELGRYIIYSSELQKIQLPDLSAGLYIGMVVFQNGTKDVIKFIVE